MKINFQALYDNVTYQDNAITLLNVKNEIDSETLETLQKALYTLYHFNKKCVQKYGNVKEF